MIYLLGEVSHLKLMLDQMYPFWACIISMLSAQLLKPLFHYLKTNKWDCSQIWASGGYPSSHTAAVSALSLSVGIQERFSSTIFAVVLAFSMIVAYDAANVRRYAGRNIQITQQLIKDVQEITDAKLDDPVYFLKVKNVLGHEWLEVFGGILHGVMIALILFYW